MSEEKEGRKREVRDVTALAYAHGLWVDWLGCECMATESVSADERVIRMVTGEEP